MRHKYTLKNFIIKFKCHITLDPFPVKSYSNAKQNLAIILENRDTFNSFIKANEKLTVPYYKHVIYGNGKEIIHTILWIMVLDSSVERLDYFGDIDYMGFNIPYLTNKKLIEQNLPQKIEYASIFYEKSIKKALKLNLNSIIDEKLKLCPDPYFMNISEDIRTKIASLFSNDIRIPQEILTENELFSIISNLNN